MAEEIIKIVSLSTPPIPIWAVYFDDDDGIYYTPVIAVAAIRRIEDGEAYDYLHLLVFEYEGGITQLYDLPEDTHGFLGFEYKAGGLNCYCWEEAIADYLRCERRNTSKTK